MGKKLIEGIKQEFLYSVGTKLNMIFAVTIALFVLFSIYNSYIMMIMNKSNDQISANYYSTAKLKEYAIQCNSSVSEYLRNGNRSNLADFNNTSYRFRQVLRGMEEKQSNIETLYLMRSIEDSFDTYSATCSLACFKYYSKDYEYYSYMYQAQGINEYIQRYCDNLLQILLENGNQMYKRMKANQELLTTVNGMVIVGFLLLFGVSMTYVNLYITNPLNQLVTAAKKIAKGDFDVKVKNIKDNNTIHVLFNAFNIMTQSIKSMMESIKEKAETEKTLLLEKQKNVEYQKMLSDANFLALQSQTNPHFMFNTLNSISRTITLGMEEKAVMMIDAMAVLLRYNLTDANLPVTLSQELAITKEYLKIQQYRFGDRISVKVDCNQKLAEKVVIPRFTLQPMVENAMIHGLEPKENGGMIKIMVQNKGQSCVIKVMDNGIGIAPDMLEQIRTGNSKTEHTNSIGVSNTKKRLEIFTHQNTSFQIFSKQGRGTVIKIMVPVQKEKENV